MSKTQTATTMHGTVEYETVECSSCGNEVAKDDASRFVIIHDLKKEREWSDHYEWEAYDYVEGYACPYCSEDPIDFPRVQNASRVVGALYRSVFKDPDVNMFRLSVILFSIFSAILWLAFIAAMLGVPMQ